MSSEFRVQVISPYKYTIYNDENDENDRISCCIRHLRDI